MKTLAYATALTALTVVGAHAQTSYETGSITATSTDNGVTQTVESQYVSATTIAPTIPGGVIGDAPATPVETSDNAVKVKLPDGTLLNIADSDDAPWNKDSRLQGYDRFTFDPESGAFVASKGDDKWANNWDENGNRVKKAAPAPAPKKVAKKKAAAPKAEEAAPADEAPASEAPATDTPATDATPDTGASATPDTSAAPKDSSTGDVPTPATTPATK